MENSSTPNQTRLPSLNGMPVIKAIGAEDETNTLSIGRYQFTLRANQTLQLPEFAGSLLRGSFGWALRGLTCITKLNECNQCPLYTTCHYPALFNPQPSEKLATRFPSIPAPYLFSPVYGETGWVEQNDEFTFGLTLFGANAIAQLPLIILAWQRASSLGLGKGRAQAELIKVDHILGTNMQTIYEPGSRVVAHEAKIQLVDLQEPLTSITLELMTPTRIQFENRIMSPEKLNADIFLSALQRKVMLYGACYLGYEPDLLTFDAEFEFDAVLTRRNFHRYSNRQKQHMNLEGLTGTVTITGELQPWWRYLQLGQYTHIGKNTSFGLGHYEITHLNGQVYQIV